jgi:uncharacterized protein YjbJ (UPF0337 family)
MREARGKRQKARGKRQEARGKRQEARGKRQEARGKRVSSIAFLFRHGFGQYRTDMQRTAADGAVI